MFTLQEVNLICGIGWDELFDDRVGLTFHEKENGWTEEVTLSCKEWYHHIRLTAPAMTTHLPQTLYFRLNDFRALFRRLRHNYKDLSVVLPLEFRSDGFEVKDGPARGTKVLAVLPRK